MSGEHWVMGDVPGNKWGWGGGGARDISGCPGPYLFPHHTPPASPSRT